MMVTMVDIVWGRLSAMCPGPTACALVISVLSQCYKTVKDCGTEGCVSDSLTSRHLHHEIHHELPILELLFRGLLAESPKCFCVSPANFHVALPTDSISATPRSTR